MWGIKLKGFIRQVDLSYSQGYDDDNGEEGKEDNVNYDKDDMNNKDNLFVYLFIWIIITRGHNNDHNSDNLMS